MDVCFESVSVTYPSVLRALDSISLHIPSGQFCVLLGRSGSGKSTLLRTINGLVVPTSGTVAVGNITVAGYGVAKVRRQIAMVHQDFALVSRASARQNIIHGAAAEMPFWRVLLGIASPVQSARAIALSHSVGLDFEMLNRRVNHLSGGQQQRVGIARALMLDPKVILVDEPLSNLDPGTANDMLALLKAHARTTGATVICSLHQPELAHQYADRIVGLEAGRVVFDCAAAHFCNADVAKLYHDKQPHLMAVA